MQPIFLKYQHHIFLKYPQVQLRFLQILTFSDLCHPQQIHVIISIHKALYLLFHKILKVTNETILYADLNLLNTLMLAIEGLLFFPKQMHECNHYQTKLQQYHLFFRNLLLYIYPLKIFEDCQKTNNQNLLFHIYLQYFH